MRGSRTLLCTAAFVTQQRGCACCMSVHFWAIVCVTNRGLWAPLWTTLWGKQNRKIFTKQHQSLLKGWSTINTIIENNIFSKISMNRQLLWQVTIMDEQLIAINGYLQVYCFAINKQTKKLNILTHILPIVNSKISCLWGSIIYKTWKHCWLFWNAYDSCISLAAFQSSLQN